MVITVLEARVAPENEGALRTAYVAAVKQLDPGIVETFLVASVKDYRLWRILTVWESREALDAMRQSGQPPRGVLIFREAAADAVLSIFDVADHARA